MTSTTLEPATTSPRAYAWPQARVLGWVGLAAILALAATLRFANLDSLGYVNHYYTAGVTSMLQSWRNFFFVAAEPGGAVSIDKSPAGLWVQAISAYFLGVNGFSVLLPEILCGLASIAVLYHLVRRAYGVGAGLLAALALALTPIVIATDRNNTMDSILIFDLLLATWAFIKATESNQKRYLLLGAALVGVGFNIKMLQAYLILPALYALYFFGADARWRDKIGRLALATVVLGVVSFAWVAAVELTPTDQRPYVGSSTNNSMVSLIFGYNGAQRLLGGGPGGRGGGPDGQRPQFDGQSQPPQFNTQNPPPLNDGRLQADGNGGPPGGGGGFPGTGQAGVLRLFIAPLSKEVSWLLPVALVAMGLLAFGKRLSFPLTSDRQMLVLWGGWLVTGGVFFSIAGFFHEYYLSMLAAPLAALVGIGVVKVWQLWQTAPRLALGLGLGAATFTLGFQLYTALSFISMTWWLWLTLGVFIVGAVMVLVSARTFGSVGLASGFGTLLTALLLIPGVWSGLTMLNSSSNQSLPAAYSGQVSGPSNNGGLNVNQALLDYLTTNTQDMEYLMAVPSSMQGADYVIATQRPVLYLGGFSGQDNVISTEGLEQLVADHQLRYIYWSEGGGGGPGGGRPNLTQWVTSVCTVVPGFNTASISAGAPDGVQGGLSNGGIPGGPGRQMQMTLYDCGAGG